MAAGDGAVVGAIGVTTGVAGGVVEASVVSVAGEVSVCVDAVGAVIVRVSSRAGGGGGGVSTLCFSAYSVGCKFGASPSFITNLPFIPLSSDGV